MAHLKEPSAPAGDDKDEEPDRHAPGGGGGPARRWGRAVHATLQTVDLATGEGLRELAAAQASAENVPAQAAEVERLARAALDSDVVRGGGGALALLRVLYVGAPVGDRTLEGVVDLLFEGDAGLEVVDYKTDRVEGVEGDRPGPGPPPPAGGRLRPGRGVVGLGRPVVRCTFLFLRSDGAVARSRHRPGGGQGRGRAPRSLAG